MSKYWSELTKKLIPYIPGEQPKDKKYVKLNTNENPYPPSQKVANAIKEFDSNDLRLYPDPDASILKKTIGKYYYLDEKNVFIGNGSDEVLAFAFMSFFQPGKNIVFPDISYSFYEVYANIFNIDYFEVPLEEDFSINIEGLYNSKGGVLVPNPNAPTGIALTKEQIIQILDNNKDVVVIVDEAYVDFGAYSSVDLIKEYPNLLVVQTLSKSRSLAGMRVGYAMGHEDLIIALERVKNSINSYTIDRLAVVAAVAAIEDDTSFQKNREAIIKTRDFVSLRLKEIGFKVLDSKANFIFISHNSIDAEILFQELKRKDVLVRYFNKKRIDNYLRVTIGSEEEMKAFLENIEIIVNENI
ncbi:histidinol-phosphate transaminase [Clostridium sp. DL1XJH146]